MNSKVFIFVIFIYKVWASAHNSKSPAPNTLLNDLKQMFSPSLFRALLEERFPWKVSVDDHLIIRFLTASDFDMNKAYQALVDYLAWRRVLNVDNILDEDWSDMEERFPYDVMVSFPNREQDPAVTLQIYLGEWDSIENHGPQSKETERFVRYAAAKMMEDADRRLRSLTSADNNPKFSVIVNFEGFRMNMEESAENVNDTQNLIQALAQHWKEATSLFAFINAPHVPDSLCTWSTEGKFYCK